MICRTCGEAYPEFGDGWNGECGNCADRTYLAEFPDEAPEECPAGGPHTPTNASSHPDRMYDPYWHCDECGASLPTPERSY